MCLQGRIYKNVNKALKNKKKSVEDMGSGGGGGGGGKGGESLTEKTTK